MGMKWELEWELGMDLDDVPGPDLSSDCKSDLTIQLSEAWGGVRSEQEEWEHDAKGS